VLKRLITFMMVLSIFTVSAHATAQNGLKAAFDELSYSLNVEWDQKDQDFYKAKMKAFNASMKDLQAQGITNAELIEFVKSEVKDEKIARDMETAFNIIALNKMSSAEASKYMIETMEKSYSNGASWNGGADVLLGLGVLLVVVAVILGGGFHVNTGSSYCGYSAWYCGETCYGYPYYYCEPNYCCWY
jgi:ApbE superfamily uncharacterized protein (UPF0280 family)